MRFTTKLFFGVIFAYLVLTAIYLGAGAAVSQTNPPRPVWVTTFDGNGADVDGIAITSDSNVSIGGMFPGRLDFAGERFRSNGRRDGIIASLDGATGEPRWIHTFGGAGDENIFDVTSYGNLTIVSGYFGGAFDFLGVPLRAQGTHDMLVAALDTDGQLVWHQVFTSPGGVGGNEIDVYNGTVLVGGIANADVKIGDEIMPYGGGGRDSFLVTLDAFTGDIKETLFINSRFSERVRAVSISGIGTFVGLEVIIDRDKRRDGGLLLATPQLERGLKLFPPELATAGDDHVRGTLARSDVAYISSYLAEPPTDMLVMIDAHSLYPIWRVDVKGPRLGGAEITGDKENLFVSHTLGGTTIWERGGEVIYEAQIRGQRAALAAYTPSGDVDWMYLYPRNTAGGSGVLDSSPTHVAHSIRRERTMTEIYLFPR